MVELVETDWAMLEMAADSCCRFTTDQRDPTMIRLKEAGLVEPNIGQGIRWVATEAGQELLNKHSVLGICSVCRSPQRRIDGHSMACDKGHMDAPSKTPCSVCAELDTTMPELGCKQGHEPDLPPEPTCDRWRFVGYDALRRAERGLIDL